ncbi:MAG: acyl-CoA thioesterase [Paludibacteraceae bacterium]
MITYDYQFRVLYPDTDRMGTMHHTNYVKYCETARWELLRSIGVPYKAVEDLGIMCPVVDMYFEFLKPTNYDALLTVKTTLREIKGVRMWFEYEFFNENDELINKAETQIAFVRKDNWKPCAPPKALLNAIEQTQ